MLELSKRSFLRLAGLSIVSRILPVGLLDKILAAHRIGTARGRTVIIVTFGGGVRYAETFAREGLHNIPRLHKLQSSGHFSRTCINQGVLFHFNSTASIITGNWQRVDDFGFQPPAAPTLFEYYRKGTRAGPMDAWVIATNKSFANIGASANRDWGLPVGANVVLPKQLLLDAVKGIVQKRTDNGVADRDNVLRQLESILNEGYEGVGWTIFKAGRQMDHNVRETLTRGLSEYINGPEVTNSGDELTFYDTREVMREFSPRLMLVTFWDMDVAHRGYYSLYLQAITRTDRLTGMLWDTVQENPNYRDKTTVPILPELGRDGDANASNGFLNHRSGDASCRNMWMLALGAGATAGETERPVEHVDVASTALRLLGSSVSGMKGRALSEILV